MISIYYTLFFSSVKYNYLILANNGYFIDIDKYIVYNYVENIWYYGSMARSAWLDSGLRNFPLAATYNGVLVDHENGIDDNETGTTAAISSFITSAEFDLDDGHQFMLMSRVLPDVSFEGSTADSPAVAMTFFGLGSSGSCALVLGACWDPFVFVLLWCWCMLVFVVLGLYSRFVAKLWV